MAVLLGHGRRGELDQGEEANLVDGRYWPRSDHHPLGHLQSSEDIASHEPALVAVVNVGEDAIRYLETLPPSAVREIHLAGHARSDIDGRGLLIDDHGAAVCDGVWALFDYAISRFGSVPSLIERDRNLPPLADLVAEADIARRVHAAAA